MMQPEITEIPAMLAETPIEIFLNNSALLIGVAVFALFMIMLGIASRFYKRASKEMSYVRTGLGGQKVVADGGAIVLPIFHQITPVNMMTLRLVVERKNEEALITFDRIRADVSAEFYVRVSKDVEAIAQAAQSFGNKTLNPHELKELLQGKFVDALRSVAAQMDMQTLHEKRVDFVQSVQTTVAEDLAKNGLELEAVSLTGFDQTSIDYFNASNSFDAQGLANIAKITEAKREERNRIEQETRVQIEQKNLEAERKSLTIKQEGEFARLEQEKAIATLRAEQESQVKTEQSRRRREAEEAEIMAQKQVAMQVIIKEREIEATNIEKEKQIQMTDILRLQAVQLAEQESAVTVAKKSEEKSKAEAEAAVAMADKVKNEENVVTVRRLAEANRAKEVEVIKAREDAEKNATRITVAAEAEKTAAMDMAEAKLTTARAEAEAIIIRADADHKRFETEAYGEQSINNAKNIKSAATLEYGFKHALADLAPAIISASVKPMEKIESMRVISTNGSLFGGGGSGSGDAAASGGSGNMPDQLIGALMKHRLQVPLIDDLLKQLGIDPVNPAKLPEALTTEPLTSVADPVVPDLIKGESGSHDVSHSDSAE